MNHDPANLSHPARHPDREIPLPFWRSRYAIGFLVFSAVAAYFLLSEHRAHFFGALPFLLLLACPLMHIFMHGDHDGHGGGHSVQAGDTPAASSPEPEPGPVPKAGAQP